MSALNAINDHNRLRLTLPRADFEVQLDVDLPARGITVLFGASGSGKTSVLRAVAGLERPLDALIRFGDAVWQDDAAGVFVPTWQRAIGYVFQEASLFDHLDVRANLRYGLSRRAGASEAALSDAVDLLGIGALMSRRTSQLSGGERQRVAIARALATRPQVLLLDEPLASIDQARRQEILPWLEKLRDDARIPMLYVTHAAQEVARLADHLVVMERGHVKTAGPVADVLAAIDTPIALNDDVGALLTGTVVELDTAWHLCHVALDGAGESGGLWLRDSGLPLGQRVRLRVLARDVSLTTQPAQHTSIQNQLHGVVDALADTAGTEAHPSQQLVRLRCGQALLLARITRRAAHQLGLTVGTPVWLQVKSVALVD